MTGYFCMKIHFTLIAGYFCMKIHYTLIAGYFCMKTDCGQFLILYRSQSEWTREADDAVARLRGPVRAQGASHWEDEEDGGGSSACPGLLYTTSHTDHGLCLFLWLDLLWGYSQRVSYIHLYNCIPCVQSHSWMYVYGPVEHKNKDSCIFILSSH